MKIQLSIQRLVLAGLVQFGVVSVAQAHGALAIDGNQKSRYGWAVNFPSAQAARTHALRQCGRNCSVVLTFSRGCGAYAADQSRGASYYGWAQTRDGSSARRRAVRECQSRGGQSCIVRVWGCNRY